MNLKRLVILILILPLVFPMGCKKADDAEILSDSVSEDVIDKGGFDELSKGSFILTKDGLNGGASFYIDDKSKGSFSGACYEVDSSASGMDYDGVTSSNSFAGSFSKPQEVDEFTYTCEVEDLVVGETVGEEQIKDGKKYVNMEPFGIAKGAKVTIIYPGASISNIPDDFIDWAKKSYYFEGDTLPVIGLMIEVDGINYGWILQTE